ncbi:MAG: microcompartment protein [Alkaliphilus sp.]|nr:BMC domain-containing protein [bacterium AH-315-L21]MBN4069342.1 BMC domain-containing protein [bacterium AH-315-G05]PHS35913.1 MAG: microcompartment protein [Alkaliphilus sp.]
MSKALGIIETIGLTPAIAALDSATKNAEVTFVGYEKVIGVGAAVSISIQLVGDVAAVQASVEAGVNAAQKVGIVIAHHVIPRPSSEIDKISEQFEFKAK